MLPKAFEEKYPTKSAAWQAWEGLFAQARPRCNALAKEQGHISISDVISIVREVFGDYSDNVLFNLSFDVLKAYDGGSLEMQVLDNQRNVVPLDDLRDHLGDKDWLETHLRWIPT